MELRQCRGKRDDVIESDIRRRERESQQMAGLSNEEIMNVHIVKTLRSNVSLILLLLLCRAGAADAVPSFARQSGQECPACHVSWPELTPYGRFFKATGYTIGRTFWSTEKGEPY